MRKFKHTMLLATLIYFLMAFAMFLVMKHSENHSNNAYRVEIHRLSHEIINSGELDGVHPILPLKYAHSFEHIAGVSYINIAAATNEILTFYSPRNEYQMEIVPVTQNGSVTGYLKFEYIKNVIIKPYIIVSQVALLIAFLLVFVVLLYTNQMVIKPFHAISNLPYEMSQGNLKGDVLESKNRYFGQFLWGLGALKDALEYHKRKELKLAKDKKVILLTIAHDIKTPLNAISLYAKAVELEIYETEEEKIEAIKKIQDHIFEINTFVNDIIKSSTEDIVSIEVKNEDFYLGDLMAKVHSGYTEKCNLNKLEFIIGSYENQLLKGDLEKMYEAVGNLIENAFKYGDGRQIKITCSVEDYCMLIQVINSGTPVLDSELHPIFDSFYRGSNTEGKPGNGLGLYICKEIIKKMNGEIYAKQLQDGMAFVLVCPLS